MLPQAVGTSRTTTGFIVVARDFNKTPGEYAAEMVGKLAYDVASNEQVGKGVVGGGAAYSILSDQLR